MKIPRDCNASELVKALRQFGYVTVRQDGSHLRMTTQTNGKHHVTIPNHRPIKVGTLHDILKSIAGHQKMNVADLVSMLNL
ncbi:MAG: type II toxin-antitoxin system HicA family toxin [Verrucomicrobia bacterium]|nr:type II toxin-antitoxin system HicA family toxin [Verrucomicrobiota bacterium]